MPNIVGKIFQDRRIWIITIIAFLLLITIFDKNNLIEAYRLRKEITGLELQKEYYQEKITADSLLLENLRIDSYLEKYARENYLMKRKGEVIYILK